MTNVLNEEFMESLRGQTLFRDVPFDDIKDLLITCKTQHLDEGETLLRAGDHNQSLFLILKGRLEVYLPTDNSSPVVVLEQGQSVGEISIIDQQPASANVIATDETELLIIKEVDLWKLVEVSHAVAKNMLLILAQRMRYGNTMINKIRNLLREYEYTASVDPLTNLYNRRWLDNMASRVMQRCHANKQPLTGVMIDIDHFKSYNDQHGHLAGDQALEQVAATIQTNLRPEDHVTRYGGEEFFALLPGLDTTSAETVAERVRQAVEETQITSIDGSPLPSLTISMGVAEMKDEINASSLIHAADEALYRAKNSGRNQIAF